MDSTVTPRAHDSSCLTKALLKIEIQQVTGDPKEDSKLLAALAVAWGWGPKILSAGDLYNLLDLRPKCSQVCHKCRRRLWEMLHLAGDT